MSSYYPSFNYLGINSRDKGLVISHFDSDVGESDTFLGMEPIYTESADGSRRLDYGAKYNNVASFRITTIKPDGSDLSTSEVREHLKWLTGSKQNSSLELVEHFSEEFAMPQKKVAYFKLNNTDVGKNLLDYTQMVPGNKLTTRGDILNDGTLHIYTLENQQYAGVKGSILKLKRGLTYTFSLDVTEIRDGEVRFGFRYGPGQVEPENKFVQSAVVPSAGHYAIQITPDTDIDAYPSILVTWEGDGTSDAILSGDALFKNIQVEINSVDTSYVPGSIYRSLDTRIFSVSIDGVFLGEGPTGFIYDSFDGVIRINNVNGGHVVTVCYGRVKYSFTGRITNAWQYKMDARTVGLIFEFTSVSPWAYSVPQKITRQITPWNPAVITIDNKSDDLYSYTPVNVSFRRDGDDSTLQIENVQTGDITSITDIAQNEIIALSDNMMITSSDKTRIFGDSFNFVFPKLMPGENLLNVFGSGYITFKYVYCIKIGDCAMDINVVSDPIYDDDGHIQLDTLPWSRIVNAPTTYQGYGITNVYSKAEVNTLVEIDENELDRMLSEELN